jgi:hypothetical protein
MSETTVTIEQIKEVVSNAHKNKGQLWLTGYVSSDGMVSNMVVEFLGPDGYNIVLTQSLDLIQKGAVELDTREGIAVGAQAAAALAASWSKSLNGLHTERQFKDPLNYDEIDKQGYTVNSAGQVVLKNMLCILSAVTRTVDRNEGNTPLVRAKKEILARTPMGKFRGQLNLSPEKLESIAWKSKK